MYIVTLVLACLASAGPGCRARKSSEPVHSICWQEKSNSPKVLAAFLLAFNPTARLQDAISGRGRHLTGLALSDPVGHWHNCIQTMHGAVVTCSMAADRSSVGVIGGGIAGITAARVLAQAGVPVALHERCSQLGGRLGTIEVAGRVVGAGCSYIKAQHPDFVAQLERWEQQGFVAEWLTPKPHIIKAPGVWSALDMKGERWFVGRPHMGSPIQLSAEEQTQIQLCQGEVFDINYESSEWILCSSLDDGESLENVEWAEDAEEFGEEVELEELDQEESTSYLHSSLIVATPIHEAQRFLARKVLDKALGKARYKDFVKERVAVAVIFEASLELPFNFAAIQGSSVTVAICDSSRAAAAGEGAGDQDSKEIWVLQSATDWAKKMLQTKWTYEDMSTSLISAFAKALGREGKMPTVHACKAVIWPYGDMDYKIDTGCIWLGDLQLAMAGDWAFDGRVEGAWLSGKAAAERVLASHSES